MASTKKIKTQVADSEKAKLDQQLDQLIKQLNQRLDQYEKINGKPYHVQLKDGNDYDYINPQHYVQADGKQTWERMVDEFGLYETAIFCKLNAYKYADRSGKKPNEDVERENKKIKWYEDKAAELFKSMDDLNNWNLIEFQSKK